VALSVLVPCGGARAQDIFARRDEWQRTRDIVAAMGGARSKQVTDVAAGRGYLTKALSSAVGPSGRVFAVEIGAAELAALRALARDSLHNVDVVEGAVDDPHLRRDLDAAFALDSYHEFSNYRSMLAAILRALKPGGVFVVVDNAPFNDWTNRPREFQASHHALASARAVEELQSAGFEIARRDDRFITSPVEQWLIVTRRPTSDAPRTRRRGASRTARAVRR
jgi:predicted methyltransferase